MSFHEDFSRNEGRKDISAKNFGYTFAIFLLVVGLWKNLAMAYLLAAFAAGLCTYLKPTIWQWPAKMWTEFSNLLHRLTSPVILAIIFFMVFCPMGLLMSLLGQRPLSLKWDLRRKTYWQPSQDCDFRKQF